MLNVKPPDAARAVAPVEGEMAAAVGENRKMVIFPLDQVPEMARGRGVRLQRHKDGGLSDVTTFKAAATGLNWVGDGGRVQSVAQGACRLARQPRRRRPGAAGPFPRQSEIRPACRERQERERQERRARTAGGGCGDWSAKRCGFAARRSSAAFMRRDRVSNSPRTRSSGRIFPGSRSRFRRRTASRRGGARRPSRSDCACASPSP